MTWTQRVLPLRLYTSRGLQREFFVKGSPEPSCIDRGHSDAAQTYLAFKSP